MGDAHGRGNLQQSDIGFQAPLGVLILRGIAGVSTPRLLWPLVGAVPIAAVAAILTRRDIPSPQIIRALFDANGSCGGLLMASSEIPLQNEERRS